MTEHDFCIHLPEHLVSDHFALPALINVMIQSSIPVAMVDKNVLHLASRISNYNQAHSHLIMSDEAALLIPTGPE